MTGEIYDLTAIVTETTATSGVEQGDLLCRFVDIALLGNAAELAEIRQELRSTLGDAAFVDTCATLASFNSVVKIAD
nr:hypothetical protein [Granulosicoccus sp.]